MLSQRTHRAVTVGPDGSVAESRGMSKKPTKRDLSSTEADRTSWKSEQEERIALIEEREREEARRFSSDEESGGAFRGVRNFNPGAPSRFGKLRVLSRFLILATYLMLGLTIAGIGVTVWMWQDGLFSAPGWFALAIVGWCLLGGFLFSLFKFLAELSWLLADLGDHQLDARNLLIDMRDDDQRSQFSLGSSTRERLPATRSEDSRSKRRRGSNTD